MSDDHPSTPSARPPGHPEQESDLRSIRPIVVVFVVLILITIAFSAWAALVVRWQTGAFFDPEPAGPDAAVLERTAIQFELFDLEAVGLEMRDRDRARLNAFGWVDRERHVVHVPIDMAMQLRVEQLQRSAPTEGVEP